MDSQHDAALYAQFVERGVDPELIAAIGEEELAEAVLDVVSADDERLPHRKDGVVDCHAIARAIRREAARRVAAKGE